MFSFKFKLIKKIVLKDDFSTLRFDTNINEKLENLSIFNGHLLKENECLKKKNEILIKEKNLLIQKAEETVQKAKETGISQDDRSEGTNYKYFSIFLITKFRNCRECWTSF